MALLFMSLTSVVTVVRRIIIAMMSLTRPISCVFQRFLFLSLSFLIGLLELLSFDELDFFDDEYDDDGS